MATHYTNMCDVVHGGQAGPLMKIRPLDTTDYAADKLVAGRVVHIDSNGNFNAGLGTNTDMPLFLFRGSESPSVYSSGTVGGSVEWVSGYADDDRTGDGAIAYVASGGFELQSTEFDSTKTYNINDLLTSDSDGKLTNAGITLYTTPVVGVASVHENMQNYDMESFTPAPVGTTVNNVSVITFWSVYLPGPDAE